MRPSTSALNQESSVPGTTTSRRTKRRAKAITGPPERRLRVEVPSLTLDLATEQAQRVLTDAGLKQQVSRVYSEPASHLPGYIATVALLRVGADADAVAGVLSALPGAEVWCGVAAVAVWRAT
jgi:hypothetical protein